MLYLYQFLTPGNFTHILKCSSQVGTSQNKKLEYFAITDLCMYDPYGKICVVIHLTDTYSIMILFLLLL